MSGTTVELLPGTPAALPLRPPEHIALDELQAELRRLSGHQQRQLRDIARALRHHGHDAYTAFNRALLSLPSPEDTQ